VKVLFNDIEIYKNYLLCMFMTDDCKVGYVERWNDEPWDKDKLAKYLTLQDYEIITFNGNNFDIPLQRLALTNVSTQKVKSAADAIIKSNLRGWQFEKSYVLSSVQPNTIDLIEVAPGFVSLKMYGARMHMRELEDLPFDPDAVLTKLDAEHLKKYCRKDLLNTRELFHRLTPQIDLRRALQAQLEAEVRAAGVESVFTVDDLRSKSDAQISESVLKQAVFLATGAIPRKTNIPPRSFKYVAPDYIKFRTPVLQELLVKLCEPVFTFDASGHVVMPDALSNLTVTVGETTYSIGIGGLHSQEESVVHRATEDTIIEDIDVASYYPSLMLNLGMYPDALGPEFLKTYRKIRDERVEAKHNGNKTKADTYKIVLNGCYGKTSSKYSILYNPKMTMYVTLTGQLAILMLIEWLTLAKIPVVSANTDGIVVHCKKTQSVKLDAIVNLWEKATKLETEKTQYKSLYMRDVNSYIAVKPDGKVKTKGAYALEGLNKNPNLPICVEAVIESVRSGKPTTDTIKECQDIRKFLIARNVTGGAEKEGVPIGKVVRWYYAKGYTGTINYVKNGNTVPKSKGAKPCMNLSDDFPDDIDYDRYYKEASEMLKDIGAVKRPPKPRLPRRNTKEWKALEALGLVEVEDGTPQWAVAYAEIPVVYKQEKV